MSLIDIISGIIDQRPDVVLMLIGIHIAIPLSYILRKLPAGRPRLIYSVLAGMMLVYISYGIYSMFALINILVCFGMMKMLNRARVGWTITVFIIIHTGIFHLERMIYHYGSYDMNISMVLMVQCLHLAFVAWDYADGAFEGTLNKKAIRDMPSLLELLAASFNPACCLGGPSVRFVDFKDYIYRRGDFEKIPACGREVIRRVLTAFAWLGIYLLLVRPYPYTMLYSPTFYTSSFFHRLYYLLMSGFAVRGKYYFAFKIIEASTVISGMAFNGYDKESKEPLFNRVYLVDIYNTELCVFHRAVVEEWNKQVPQWLKDCIHNRVNGGQLVRAFVTFMVSAIWHGFYPLYFISFFFYFISQTNFQFIYKCFVKYSLLRRPIYFFIMFSILHISIAYFCNIFMMLLIENVLVFSKGLVWIPILHCAFFFIVLVMDTKEPKLRLNYPKLSYMKLYEINKEETSLVG